MGHTLTRHGAVLGTEMFGTCTGLGGHLGTQKCPRRRRGHLGLYITNTSIGWQFCNGSSPRVFTESSSPKIGCHQGITPHKWDTGPIWCLLELPKVPMGRDLLKALGRSHHLAAQHSFQPEGPRAENYGCGEHEGHWRSSTTTGTNGGRTVE